MSDTYRHITKNLEKNEYAKRIFRSHFECQDFYDSKEERLKRFLISYHRDGSKQNAPKSFRKILNNQKRNKDTQKLIRHIKYEDYDNMISFKWKKDANYYYF